MERTIPSNVLAAWLSLSGSTPSSAPAGLANVQHMQTEPDTCQLGSVECAAHYAAAFAPFKGRSHRTDANQSRGSSIPAVHQRKLTLSAQDTALVQTSALRPLQREEFLAKLPKVQLLACSYCTIGMDQGMIAQLQAFIGLPTTIHDGPLHLSLCQCYALTEHKSSSHNTTSAVVWLIIQKSGGRNTACSFQAC